MIINKVAAAGFAGLLLVAGLAGCAQQSQEEKALKTLEDAGLYKEKDYGKATPKDYDAAYEKLVAADKELKQLVEEATELKTECEALQYQAYSASACHELLYWKPMSRLEPKTDITEETPEEIASVIDSLGYRQREFSRDIEKLNTDMDAVRQEMADMSR